MPARSEPTWRYKSDRGILYMRGDSFRHDMDHAWELIESGRVPFVVEAIVHTVTGMEVPMLVCGHVLSTWLVDRACPDPLWHLETQAMRQSA